MTAVREWWVVREVSLRVLDQFYEKGTPETKAKIRRLAEAEMAKLEKEVPEWLLTTLKERKGGRGR